MTDTRRIPETTTDKQIFAKLHEKTNESDRHYCVGTAGNRIINRHLLALSNQPGVTSETVTRYALQLTCDNCGTIDLYDAGVLGLLES